MKDSIEKTVLDLTANALFDAGHEISSSSDETFWKDVYDECKVQAIPNIAARALPEMDNKVLEEWKEYNDFNLFQNMRILNAHKNIHQLMTKNNIPYVILKGWASSRYYPDPYARLLGDVDFLIDKTELEHAQKVLEAEGYKCLNTEEQDNHHMVYVKNDISFEMHFELNGIPMEASGDKIRALLPDFIKCAVLDSKMDLMLPSEFHHGLIILLHNSHHMLTSGIGVKHLSDWAVFVNHVGDRFPEVFEKALKKYGLWEYANIMTAVCTFAIGMPKQKWCKTYDENFLKKTLDDIIEKGHLGSKVKDASSEWFMNDAGNRAESKGIVMNFLLNMNDVVDRHWHLQKKCKLIYPIGWIYFFIRYVILSLMGKKKKINIDVIHNAAQRNNLYKEFHMFESEE